MNTPFLSRSRKIAGRLLLALSILFLGFAALSWHLLKPYYHRAQVYDLSNIENLPITTVLYDRHGDILGKTFEENRFILRKGEITANVANAMVAAEDRRFFRHKGLDLRGILRAAWSNIRSGEINQGASTITQQLAKHVIGDFRRTFDRKIVEAFLTLRLEEIYSKDEILRLYMNRIYFGSGYFGVEAAAQGYFGKSSKELSLSEAAMMMSIVRAPTSGSPRNNIDQAGLRMKRTLKIMQEEKMITSLQYEQALKESIHVVNRESDGDQNHFMVTVLKQAGEIMDLTHREQVPQGLRIFTTLDMPLQKLAEAEMETNLSDYELIPASGGSNKGMDGAYLGMDSDSGEILVYVGSRNFAEQKFDHLRLMKRDSSGLQNPFIHAYALETWNLTPASLLDASYLSEEGGEPVGKVLLKSPDRTSLMWHDSLVFNSPFSERRLIENLGWPALGAWLQKAGWEDHAGGAPSDPKQLNLLQLASLYRSLSHEGKSIPPVFIRSIENSLGEVLYENKPPVETSFLSSSVASQVLYALQQRTAEGSSRLTSKFLTSPVSMAVTEATSSGHLDSWVAGVSPRYVSLSWMGWDDARSFPSRRVALNASIPYWSKMADHLEEQGAGKSSFAKMDGFTKIEIDRQSAKIKGFAYTQAAIGNTLLFLTDEQLKAAKAAESTSEVVSRKPENSSAWFSTILASEEASVARFPGESDFLIPNTIPEKTEFIVPGRRGEILDRNGKVLATNRKAQQLVCRWPPLQRVATEVEVLAWVHDRKKMAEELFGEPLPELTPLEIIESFQYRRFLPFVLKSNLTQEQVRQFSASTLETQGLSLQGIPYRYYPNGKLLAQTLGYVSLKQASARGQYLASEVIHESFRGESGLESRLEKSLAGEPGLLKISTNRDGFLSTSLISDAPKQGANARLAIDFDWQTAVEDSLAHQTLPGAGVVMDVQTGDILAMASYPSFDPNSFVPRLPAEEWKALVENSEKPLLHRVYRQHYPPGSVFKIVTTIASMVSGSFDPNRTVECVGYYDVGNVRYNIPREVGVVNYRKAMALSFNSYFFDMSLRMGRDILVRTAKDAGFGQSTGFLLPQEEAGRVPDPAFVLEQHHRWMGPGDVTNMSIGQGDVLVTPLQMAVFMSAVANKGHLFLPRLLRQLETPLGVSEESFPVRESGQLSLTNEQWGILHQSLRAVVLEGTAKKLQDLPVSVAVKTGTAQAGGGKKVQVAWLSGFYPLGNPKIAFVFMIEGKEGLDVSSGSNAVPVAKEAINLYLQKAGSNSAVPSFASKIPDRIE